jgi:hypothetical protein
MPLHFSGVTRPTSGGSAQLLFGVIACVGCVLATCNCAEPPEDGRVTPETCRGIDS